MIRVELTVYYELLKIERQLASYALRERKKVDYQNKLPLPRARRNKHASRIYPIEFVEEKDEQCLIHSIR